MGFSDKLKELGDKAKDATVEHRDQIKQAVETAGVAADRRTGGRYRDKILKATQQAGAAVDRVATPDEGSGTHAGAAGAQAPPAGTHAPPDGAAPPAPKPVSPPSASDAEGPEAV